jgi:cobalamin biosynthetic protein CobC
MQARLADEAADMTVSLQMRGLGVFGGTPLFLLARVRDAAHVQEALARQRIWTRVFDYAPSWIRLGLPGGAAGLARLENALDQAMAETGECCCSPMRRCSSFSPCCWMPSSVIRLLFGGVCPIRS